MLTDDVVQIAAFSPQGRLEPFENFAGRETVLSHFAEPTNARQPKHREGRSGPYLSAHKGAAIPVGTTLQELTFTGRDRPTMGLGGAQATRLSIVARPCHGILSILQPPGFRYVPAPGFGGQYMYAVRACLANGHCDITAAVVTVNP